MIQSLLVLEDLLKSTIVRSSFLILPCAFSLLYPAIAFEKLSKDGKAKEFALRLLYSAAAEVAAVSSPDTTATTLDDSSVDGVVVAFGAVKEKNKKNTDVKKL
jgi:hypothetical protein